jgi:hypothetical protein
MPSQIKDIVASIDKMELGLSRYFNNEETIAVFNIIKSSLKTQRLQIVLLHYGNIPYKPEDKFLSTTLDVTAYQIDALPSDIESTLSKTDLLIVGIYEDTKNISRDDRDHIRNLTKNIPNVALASSEEFKRDAQGYAYARRNLTVVTEDRRNDLISILKLINENVEIAIFSIIGKKDELLSNIDLLDFALKEQSQNAAAKSIITNGEFLEIQINDIRLLSKQQSVLKSKLSRSFKALTQELDQKTEDYFGITNPQMKELRSKVENFNGFKTIDLGKNTVLQMSDGFQDAIYKELEENTIDHIEKQITESIAATSLIRKELDNALYSIEVNHKLSVEEPINKNTITRIIEAVPKGQKELERSFAKKGLNQLFTELRAPIFMLMPILMLFMIFKPVLGIFTKINKKDYIDRSITESNGMPAIKIIGHPRYDKINEIYETLNDDITNDINNKQDLASSPFYIKGKLVIQHDETKEKNKSVLIPVIKLEEDGVLVLLETDRDEVLGKFEETYLTEAKKKASSSSAGIGVVIKFIQSLPGAEYILFLLMFVVGYFINKKLKEFNKEEAVESTDSKKTIKINLQNDLDRYISSIQMKWKTTQDNWLRNLQDTFQAEMENSINLKIDAENKNTQELKVLFDKRIKIFKENEKELNDYQNELKKLKQDLLTAIRL